MLQTLKNIPSQILTISTCYLLNYAQKARQIILSPTPNQEPHHVFIPENTNVSDIHQQVLLKPLLSEAPYRLRTAFLLETLIPYKCSRPASRFKLRYQNQNVETANSRSRSAAVQPTETGAHPLHLPPETEQIRLRRHRLGRLPSG